MKYQLRNSNHRNGSAFGFTLIELLVVLGILVLLVSLSVVMLLPTRVRARDSVRKTELNTIGRYLWASDCYVPTGGAGDYDAQTIFDEYVAANPTTANFISKAPRDPRIGNETMSGYRYIYEAGGRCAVYANLENADDPVTLPGVTTPSAGSGSGVLGGATTGANGTNRYYQVSR